MGGDAGPIPTLTRCAGSAFASQPRANLQCESLAPMPSSPPFELGVYSFGNTPRLADGSYGQTAQAIRDVLEAVRLADEVGLDFFGFGEHHTRSMPLSSPTALVNAAATTTRRIALGTAVTVLSTDDPLRVFQQLATAAAIAPGRIEVVAGRGSSPITFPLFDCDEREYDGLFRSKLDLLRELVGRERITWQGPHRRRGLSDTLVVPRPEQPLRLWLGTGGSPASVQRAIELGLPIFLGILGGTPAHWSRYGEAYREGWAQAGHPAADAAIAVAVHGFVAENNNAAKTAYLRHELEMFRAGYADIGRTGPAPTGRERDLDRGGMVFAGSPDEIADRILDLHAQLGHCRQIIQMDVGGLPHADFLKSIELLGTRVLPQIRKALAPR